MDIAEILALVLKGVSVIEALVAAGQSVAPAIKVVTDLVEGAQAGEITDEQLAATEATLDAMVADFNTPIA
jgi:hypothetical protein